MRTTLTIRDELYEKIRRQAFDERRTLGDVVNDLIESGLVQKSFTKPRVLGTFSGQISVTDDFDDELVEFTDSISEPIEP